MVGKLETLLAKALIDATHENQDHRLWAMAVSGTPRWTQQGLRRGLAVLAPPAMVESTTARLAAAIARTGLPSAGYQTALAEMINAHASALQVGQLRRELPMPVVVVTAGRPPHAPWLPSSTRREFESLLGELQADQLRLSRTSCHLVIANAGHFIAQEQPAAVVKALDALVTASRAGTLAALASLGCAGYPQQKEEP